MNYCKFCVRFDVRLRGCALCDVRTERASLMTRRTLSMPGVVLVCTAGASTRRRHRLARLAAARFEPC